MIVMIDPINENETILFDLFKWCQHSQVRDPSVDSFEINRLSGLGVWLLRYLVHCFSDIRLVSSDIMADFADGADGVPAIKKQRAAKAKDGVDIYKQDASVSDVFGDLKGRILLEAIWNTYQARAKAYIYIQIERFMIVCLRRVHSDEQESLNYDSISFPNTFTLKHGDQWSNI